VPTATCCPACTAGQMCLNNGTCTLVCAAPDFFCPGINCGCFGGGVETPDHCITLESECPTKSCASTADCPPGFVCKNCGGNNRCRQLCA
jgi:hypothetical protein